MTTPRSAHPRQQVILDVLSAHHPHALSVWQLAALSKLSEHTLRGVLRTMRHAGILASRFETPNEIARRITAWHWPDQIPQTRAVPVWFLIEQRPVSTFTPRPRVHPEAAHLLSRRSQRQEL